MMGIAIANAFRCGAQHRDAASHGLGESSASFDVDLVHLDWRLCMTLTAIDSKAEII